MEFEWAKKEEKKGEVEIYEKGVQTYCAIFTALFAQRLVGIEIRSRQPPLPPPKGGKWTHRGNFFTFFNAGLRFFPLMWGENAFCFHRGNLEFLKFRSFFDEVASSPQKYVPKSPKIWSINMAVSKNDPPKFGLFRSQLMRGLLPRAPEETSKPRGADLFSPRRRAK